MNFPFVSANPRKPNAVIDMYHAYFKRLYNVIASLFTYENMPDSININYLNNVLITRGRVVWTKFNDKLYCCQGNYGGEPDEYYLPTIFTVANPVLGSKMVHIKEDETQDGVLMYLTSSDVIPFENLTGGLYDLISTTAWLLADNSVSINIAQKNSRLMAIFTATSTSQKISAENVLKSLYDGDVWKVVSTDLINDFTVNPLANNNNTSSSLITLIELHQYILANFYHQIGINSNYNMKRERLNTAEIDTNFEALNINITDIKENLTKCFDNVNRFFGTNISIKFPVEWTYRREEYNERKNIEVINSKVNGDDSINDRISDFSDDTKSNG